MKQDLKQMLHAPVVDMVIAAVAEVAVVVLRNGGNRTAYCNLPAKTCFNNFAG